MCKHGVEIELPFWTRENKDYNKFKPLVVDYCLAEIITKLHSQGIRTLGSCCGHTHLCGGIIIDDHSVAKAIQLGYQVSVYYMVDYHGREFPIYDIDLKNNCKTCKFTKVDCRCGCHKK